MQISKRTAVITGGASGIGAALADAIVGRGGRVVIVDINGEAARAHADTLGTAATAMTCDVSDVAAVEAMAADAWAWTGGADLVFANAGIGLGRPLLKATEAEFDVTMGVNLKGVWAVAKAFATRMIEAEHVGHLCLTGSEHSLGLQNTGSGFYTASKHGVLALGDVLRGELPDAIGVSVLCPGLTATHMSDTTPAATGMGRPPEHRAAARAVMAEGRPPREVAEATLAAISRGDFLIMTEPSAYLAAERRAEEVKAAFAAQAPLSGNADAMKYHVESVLTRLAGKR